MKSPAATGGIKSYLKTVRVGTLKFASDNPVGHDERNLSLIGKSLAEFGQVENLVAQHGTNVLIAGEGRARAMAAAKIKSAEVRFVHCTEPQRRKLALLLNRTADLHAWSTERVKELVDETLAAGGNAETDLGFTDEDLAEMIAAAVDSAEEAIGTEEGNAPPQSNHDNQYGVVVLCETEVDQQRIYEELTSDGYNCKVVTT